MTDKASKLASARRKLKDHQEKKHVKSISASDSDNNIDTIPEYKELATQGKKYVEQIENSSNTNIDSTSCQHLQSSEYCHINMHVEENCVNATEILVSEKQSLNAKIVSLENLLQHTNHQLKQTMLQLNSSNQNVQKLEGEIKQSKKNTDILENELRFTMEKAEKYEQRLKELLEKNTELEEHFETTKNNLIARNSENQSLLSQLSQYQRELEISNLHLQQLTSGHGVICNDSTSESNMLDQIKSLQQANSKLEQQIKTLLAEKEQLSAHYQHYIHQLNEQMESTIAIRRQQEIDNEILTKREVNLIDQMSQMEIKIQALQNHISVLEQYEHPAPDGKLLEQCFDDMNQQSEVENGSKVQTLQLEEDLKSAKRLLLENENKIIELNETIDKMKSEQPDVAKLSAANESDRVAAQRATTQNIKLKDELQGFQDAFILMNSDKLELTEKLQAEKFLNRELTIKLSECEEGLRVTQNKLKAKDQEMIRLQACCSKLQKENIQTVQEMVLLRQQNVDNPEDGGDQLIKKNGKVYVDIAALKHDENNEKDQSMAPDNKSEEQESGKAKAIDVPDLSLLPTEQAMQKLQQRFLKTMKQLAELLDEKQNLEHIVLQLQGETETICEYIALYQQQRGILKQREDERETQLKYLTSERKRMQAQLEQLQNMITSDNHITGSSNHIQRERVEKIVTLLSDIKQNHLIDPHRQCSSLENFHPCPWCSGKLIDV